MIDLLVYSLFVSCAHLSHQTKSLTAHFGYHQGHLVRKLFANYDRLIAPINTIHDEADPDSFHQFKLIVELWEFQLIHVNEQERKFSAIVEYTMFWSDFRLVWDPEEFGGIQYMYLHRSKVWIPELIPHNAVSSSEIGEPYQQPVLLQSNGSLAFVVTSTISATCQFDVSAFPFDHQNCDISLDVRTMYQSEYELKAYSNSFFSYSNLGNGEWDVLCVNMEHVSHLSEHSDTEHTTATITVTFRRKPNYYILTFVFPTFVLSCITIMGIFLTGTDNITRVSLISEDSNRRDWKVSVGLSYAMSMTFLLGVLNNMLPKTDTFPLLGVYFLLQFLLISLGLSIVLLIDNRKIYSSRKTVRDVKLYHLGNVLFQILNLVMFISFCTWIPSIMQYD